MSFSKSELEELKAKLLELENTLPQDIETAKESAKPVELDQTAYGRVSRIDAIQQQQMQKAAVERLQLRLKQVKTAISKLDSDLFGCCIKCEEPISIKRLQARPESVHCINCAPG